MIQYQVSEKPRKWEKDHQSSLEELQKKRTAAALNFSLHFLQMEIYAITLKNHICLKVSVCNSFIHLVSICRIYWHPDPSIWTVTCLFVCLADQSISNKNEGSFKVNGVFNMLNLGNHSWKLFEKMEWTFIKYELTS